MQYAQLFCTIADIVADKQSPGVDEARLFQAIQEASDFVQKEIGWFIPVTLTHYFNGCNRDKLFVPPLLSVSSIVHWYGTASPITLSVSSYLLKPDNGFWPNGPYTQIWVAPFSTQLRVWCELVNGVQIIGHWGKYERSADTGATVQDASGQNGTQTTLQISDGGKVSPGMVLFVGSEQESITGWDAPTTNITALNGDISASDEVITVDDGTLVNVGETIRVDFEQMRVKDKRTNQLSVTRSWNGTGKVAHLDNATIDVYRIVKVDRAVNGTTAATHAKDTTISRYVVPNDIQFLTKEIATLSVNKAQGGYQGRSGDAQTGVVFYNDAFPQFDIEKIKANYYIPRLS